MDDFRLWHRHTEAAVKSCPLHFHFRKSIYPFSRKFKKRSQKWLFLEFSREGLMIRRKVRWHFLSATSRSTRKLNVSSPYLASFRREKENCSKNSDFHPFFEICEICRGSIFENESVMDSSWPRLWYGDVRDAGRPLRFRDNRRVRFPIVTIFAPAR